MTLSARLAEDQEPKKKTILKSKSKQRCSVPALASYNPCQQNLSHSALDRTFVLIQAISPKT